MNSYNRYYKISDSLLKKNQNITASINSPNLQQNNEMINKNVENKSDEMTKLNNNPQVYPILNDINDANKNYNKPSPSNEIFYPNNNSILNNNIYPQNPNNNNNNIYYQNNSTHNQMISHPNSISYNQVSPMNYPGSPAVVNYQPNPIVYNQQPANYQPNPLYPPANYQYYPNQNYVVAPPHYP